MTVFVLSRNQFGWNIVDIFTSWDKARSEQSRLEVVDNLSWEHYEITEWDVQ